jgi:hypothetical protein
MKQIKNGSHLVVGTHEVHFGDWASCKKCNPKPIAPERFHEGHNNCPVFNDCKPLEQSPKREPDKRFCSKCGFAKLAVVSPEDEGVCRCEPVKSTWEEKATNILEEAWNRGYDSEDFYGASGCGDLVSKLSSLLQAERKEMAKEKEKSYNEGYKHAQDVAWNKEIIEHKRKGKFR